MEEEQIIYKKVSELKNNPKNPRKNDSAVDSVAKSIEKYGFRNPLIIDKDNIVWCGNTRLKASRKLKLKKVPCIVIEDLTEQQMTELSILDNKTNEIAEWDMDMLGEMLPDLDFSDFDIDFGLGEDVEEKEVKEDDFDVEANIPEEPKAKLGSDMYQSVTGGGLMGKDLSKADVSVNIYAWLKAQEIDKPVELCCAIGDTEIDGIPYEEIVNIAREYINSVGGFEKFAEWGLVKTNYKLPTKLQSNK